MNERQIISASLFGNTFVCRDGKIIFVARGTGKERERYLEISKKGYARVDLVLQGKRKRVPVHRLVCIAFHGAPVGDRNQVNHKDGNKLNNAADNVEWCTVEENNEHSQKILGNNGVNKKFIKI